MSDVYRRLRQRLIRPLTAPANTAMQQALATELRDSMAMLHDKLDDQNRLLGWLSERMDKMEQTYGGISGRMDRAENNLELALETEFSAVNVMVSRFPWFTELYPQVKNGSKQVGDVKEDVKALLANVPQTAQDVIAGGHLIAKGSAECGPILEAILPRLHDEGTIIEFGSGLGYFSRAIARAFPKALVVSVELDRASVAVQRRLLEAEGLRNVVLVHSHLSRDWLEEVNYHSCTVFNTVLLLSTSAVTAKMDLPRVLRNLDLLAPDVIVEVPQGQDGLREAGRQISRLTSTADAEISLLHRDDYLHESSYAYIGDPKTKRDARGRPRFALESQTGGGWRFTKDGVATPYEPGVLLWDIRQLGRIVWPDVPQLLSQFDNSLRSLAADRRWDIRPWNLIYTSAGLRIIDSASQETPHDPGEVDRVRNWLSMLDV